MYNLGELVDKAAFIAQRSDDSSYKTEIKVWINLSLESLYNSYNYFDELKGTHNFTTVASTALYYMPSNFGLPLRFYDVTNDKKIKWQTEEEYFDANVANIADSVEGDVNNAYFKEVVGVNVQISSSGDKFQAKSSSASDTTQTVRVKGYLDSALTIIGFEEVTLNGTSASAGSITFYKIIHFSKSADTTGFVTLEDSSGTDLGILGQVERVARYKAFRLALIPDDSSTNMRVLYKQKFCKLVDDEDYPFVEADDYLIYNSASLAMQQEKETLDRAVMMNRLASRAMDGIIHQQNTKMGSDFQHKMVAATMVAHRA